MDNKEKLRRIVAILEEDQNYYFQHYKYPTERLEIYLKILSIIGVSEDVDLMQESLELFGHTKPLGGNAREILREVMFKSASDVPPYPGA